LEPCDLHRCGRSSSDDAELDGQTRTRRIQCLLPREGSPPLTVRTLRPPDVPKVSCPGLEPPSHHALVCWLTCEGTTVARNRRWQIGHSVLPRNSFLCFLASASANLEMSACRCWAVFRGAPALRAVRSKIHGSPSAFACGFTYPSAMSSTVLAQTGHENSIGIPKGCAIVTARGKSGTPNVEGPVPVESGSSSAPRAPRGARAPGR
jgi:hypothetical protein